MTYAEELRALDKELEEHKFLILSGRYDFFRQNLRRQWLMKAIAGPVIAPGPVPIQRMNRQVVTGFEDRPGDTK